MVPVQTGLSTLAICAPVNLAGKPFQKLVQLVRQLQLHPVAAAQLLDPELFDPLGRAIFLHIRPCDVVFVRDNE